MVLLKFFEILHTNIDKRLRNIYKKFSSNLESNENGLIRDSLHIFVVHIFYMTWIRRIDIIQKDTFLKEMCFIELYFFPFVTNNK